MRVAERERSDAGAEQFSKGGFAILIILGAYELSV